MDRGLSGAGVLGAADRLLDAPFGAEHRVSRARPAGDHGRSGLARRTLRRTRAPIRIAGSRSRGWPRTSPIFPTPRCIASSGGGCRTANLPTFSFDADFQVESYLRYQGSSFVERFDANSYLYLTRAMDYFDIAGDHDGVLAQAFRGIKTRFCVVSFTSDWLFPTSESRALVHALNASSARVSFAEIETDKRPRRLPARRARILRHLPRLPAIGRQGARAGSGWLSMALPEQTLPLPGIAPDRTGNSYRADHLLVAEMVESGSRVLDVGCGDGDLLQLLESRGIDGRGIELSREGVNRCVAKGLAVVQGDADTDLVNYPDDAFDYVILSQTLQATRQPRAVLENLLRIGQRAIVSFPNFGFWKMRLQLLVGGHMPRTENLPATWYDTPNIHFCTIKDFVAALRRDQRQDGARGGARPLRPPGAAEPALVGVEHVRRAGRVLAEPRRQGEVVRSTPCRTRRRSTRASSDSRLDAALARNDGLDQRHHRPRIAHRPAAGLDQRDEALDHLVEQRRLLQIEHVAGLREERQARRRQMLLQEQARLDAIVVLVAAQDQRRRRHFPDRLRHGVDRGTAALKAAHGVGRTLGVVPGERGVEIGVAARVLQQERNPARRLARHFCHLDRADRLILLGIGAALRAEGVEIFQTGAGADARRASSTARAPAR